MGLVGCSQENHCRCLETGDHIFFSALLVWQMTLLINLSFFLGLMLEMTNFTDRLMYLTLDIVSFICLAIS